MLAAAKKRSPHDYLVVLALLYAGLRPAEAENLVWEDLDLEHGLLHIQAKSGWTPKTHEMRTVEIKPILLNALKAAPRHHPHYVLAPPNGTKLNMGNFTRRELKPMAGEAGIDPKKVTAYTFRHSFGTWHVRSGTDLYTLMRLMGHSSLKTTLIYLHLMPRQTKEAINNLPDPPAPTLTTLANAPAINGIGSQSNFGNLTTPLGQPR